MNTAGVHPERSQGIPRPDLDHALRAHVEGGVPIVLTGPPGAGKTTLLRRLAASLEAEGWVCIYLDLMAATSSPDRLVESALDALPAGPFAARLPEALSIRRIAESGRTKGEHAVRALFDLWANADEAGGRPVALLLDEATDIRSLAYFKGLREVEQPFAKALRARCRGTILATSFPTLARRLFGFEELAVPPLTAAQLVPALEGSGRADLAEPLARASFGWPRYVRTLLECVRAGDALEDAWAREMGPGGRLETACRHTFDVLLLRSRGYGISKAVLDAVARDEGLTLTELVPRIGRTPGAVRDYLQWLVAVDALRMRGKRYYYVDGMVRSWLRLYGRGALPTEGALRQAAKEAIETVRDIDPKPKSAASTPGPRRRPPGPNETAEPTQGTTASPARVSHEIEERPTEVRESPPFSRRHDTLMEID